MSILRADALVFFGATGDLAYKVPNEKNSAASSTKEDECGSQAGADPSHLEEGVFYPFTFPITSGPARSSRCLRSRHTAS
jgi:hypothetical protein